MIQHYNEQDKKFLLAANSTVYALEIEPLKYVNNFPPPQQ